MIEDDIDRLVAEMQRVQNQPYDSSRYIESSHTENVNYGNSSDFKRESSMKKETSKSIDKLPPKYPSAGKSSHSPNRPFQPILSYTMTTPIEQNRSNFLLNTTSNQFNTTRRSNSKDFSTLTQ